MHVSLDCCCRSAVEVPLMTSRNKKEERYFNGGMTFSPCVSRPVISYCVVTPMEKNARRPPTPLQRRVVSPSFEANSCHRQHQIVLHSVCLLLFKLSLPPCEQGDVRRSNTQHINTARWPPGGHHKSARIHNT